MEIGKKIESTDESNHLVQRLWLKKWFRRMIDIAETSNAVAANNEYFSAVEAGALMAVEDHVFDLWKTTRDRSFLHLFKAMRKVSRLREEQWTKLIDKIRRDCGELSEEAERFVLR